MGDAHTDETLLFIQIPHRLIHTVLHGREPPGIPGLNRTHLRTLMNLKDLGPSPMHILGECVGMSKGSFTQVIDSLVRKKMVTRERKPDDRRVVLVSLTETGFLLTRQIDEHFRAYLADALAVLSPEEKEDLTSALKTIQRTTGLINERKHTAG